MSAMDVREDLERAEREADAARSLLGDLIAELDRRRRRALDVRTQARQHALPLAVTLALIVSGAVALVVRGVRGRSLDRRVMRLRRGLAMARDAILGR